MGCSNRIRHRRDIFQVLNRLQETSQQATSAREASDVAAAARVGFYQPCTVLVLITRQVEARLISALHVV